MFFLLGPGSLTPCGLPQPSPEGQMRETRGDLTAVFSKEKDAADGGAAKELELLHVFRGGALKVGANWKSK